MKPWKTQQTKAVISLFSDCQKVLVKTAEFKGIKPTECDPLLWFFESSSHQKSEKNEIVLAPAKILEPDAKTVKPSTADPKGTYSMLSDSKPNLNQNDQDF